MLAARLLLARPSASPPARRVAAKAAKTITMGFEKGATPQHATRRSFLP